MTAAHVVDGVGSTVVVEFLAGPGQHAAMARVEVPAAFAVLVVAKALPASVGGLVATDSVALKVDVVCIGVAEVDDAGHTYRLHGRRRVRAGGKTRDDHGPIGRVVPSPSQGTDVLRGTRTKRYRVQFDAPAAEGRVAGDLLAEM